MEVVEQEAVEVVMTEPPVIADAEVAMVPPTHVDFTAVAAEVEAVGFRTSIGEAIGEASAKKVRRSRGEKVPRWTTEEEERLRALVGQQGDRAWVKVAEALGTGRTPAGVDQHWQIMSGKRKRNGKKAESMPVATAVTTYSEGAVPEATGVVVTSFDLSSSEGVGTVALIEGGPVEKEKKTRTRRSSGKILRWTPEEEAKLKEAVDEKGVRGQWQAIAEDLGTGRTPAGVDQHWQIMSGRRKRYAQQSGKARTADEMVDDDDDAAAGGGVSVEVVPAHVVDVVDVVDPAVHYSTTAAPEHYTTTAAPEHYTTTAAPEHYTTTAAPEHYTTTAVPDSPSGMVGDAETPAPAPVYVTAPVYAAPVYAAPVNTAPVDAA